MKQIIIIILVLFMSGVVFAGEIPINNAETLPNEKVPEWQHIITIPNEKLAPYYKGNEKFPTKSITISPEYIANIAEVTKYMIESGEVCKIIGHVWGDEGSTYCNIDSDPWNSLDVDWYPSIQRPILRRCKICGKRQRKTETWEDID